jgi:hypothetical protein
MNSPFAAVRILTIFGCILSKFCSEVIDGLLENQGLGDRPSQNLLDEEIMDGFASLFDKSGHGEYMDEEIHPERGLTNIIRLFTVCSSNSPFSTSNVNPISGHMGGRYLLSRDRASILAVHMFNITPSPAVVLNARSVSIQDI